MRNLRSGLTCEKRDATPEKTQENITDDSSLSFSNLFIIARRVFGFKLQTNNCEDQTKPDLVAPMADNFENNKNGEGGGETSVPVKKVKVTSKDVNLIKKKAELLAVTKGVLQTSLDGKMSSKIDIVVVYTPSKPDRHDKLAAGRQEEEEKEKLREKFRATCKNEGFELTEEVADVPPMGEKAFIKLHCKFDTMCEYAEKLKIGMPLADCEVLGDEYYYEG